MAALGRLIINEVNYDLLTDLPVMPMATGYVSQSRRFVEIYNDSLPFGISGFTLSDASQVRHTFPLAP